MKLFTRVALVTALMAGARHSALAQSISDLPALRYLAAGTYEGKLSGDTSYIVQGDSVSERMDCTITITFREDGTATYDAGQYLYRRIYSKRTATGFVKRIFERYSSSASNLRGVPSALSIWKTQVDLVKNAMWPQISIPGSERSEVWYTDYQGKVQRKEVLPGRTGTVYCDAVVLWRTRTGDGPGLPLTGQFNGRDVRAGRTWIEASVKWSFRPIARWRS